MSNIAQTQQLDLVNVSAELDKAETQLGEIRFVLGDIVTICQSLNADETAESLSEAILEVISDTGV